MKKEYALSEQFVIISLDGLSCSHYSMAKGAALRGIAAAQLLEEILFGEKEGQGAAELSGAGEFQRKLEAGIDSVKKMDRKKLKALEKETSNFLLADGGLEIVPDLLGCDMNYYTASITIKSYRSDRDCYLSVTESVRGEILEDGPVTLECVGLLWLMRESGCLHDIFSVKEQERIQERIVSLCAQSSRSMETEKPEDASAGDREKEAETGGQPEGQNGAWKLTDADFVSMIWGQEFHKTAEQTVKSFLKGKRKLFQNPYLEGINLLFPFLDRRQAIFVDFVVFGTTVKDRRQMMRAFLTEKGHYVEEVKSGTETLLLIDNAYYRVWPKTVSCGRIPIQGASLQPVYR